MPRIVLAYGLLGLIPFLAPPLLTVAVPAHGGALALVALAYGALILSFLGGARWGLAVATPAPGLLTVSFAMLPTLAIIGLRWGWMLGSTVLVETVFDHASSQSLSSTRRCRRQMAVTGSPMATECWASVSKPSAFAPMMTKLQDCCSKRPR